MKPDAKSIVAIVILSLGIWALFYSYGMALDAPATVVTVFACAILVLGLKWVVQGIARKRSRGHES